MSDHPKRTLPLAASITHLKHEAKALRAAFDAGDADARDRVTAQVDPGPARLAQTQALFVVAREYGFPSWPVLKRHVERRTRTVFADVEGVGPALADLLGDANVTIAETLESSFDSDSEVLVLYLDVRRSDRLSADRVASLRGRKLVVTGDGANWLCRELDLEIGGGMLIWTQPLLVADTGLLAGERGDYSIEPLERPPSRESYLLRQDRRGLEWRPIHDELRLRGDTGFVEVIAQLEQKDASAVVARQANCVFAGVMAPPDDWSAPYREFFRLLVTGLAERELEDFKLAVVPRQVHPPGTVRFDLDALRGADADHARKFYFQFDRDTVLTATLRHRGSDAAMLCFQGGRQQHYWTREDAEHGETLTIAVTLRRAPIDAMAGQYWTLDVSNFDRERALSAELTVRYDALEGGAVRPLPSNASFEHFHWFAERMESGDPNGRRAATALAFGFDDWKTLQDHVAWSEPQLPHDGAHMRDGYLLEAQTKYGESFGLAELMEDMSARAKFSGDLRRALESAFATASTGKHGSVLAEHLLLALLDNPVTDDVLVKCGADTHKLRHDLLTWLESAPQGEKARVSRELFGVLYRAGFYSALGREGSNTANVLVGIFAERCVARGLLERQGMRRSDMIRYLAHGIPKSAPGSDHSSGVLSAQVEIAVHTAYARAEEQRHESFGVEHMLLALIDLAESPVQRLAAAERDEIRDNLDAFVATTPKVSVGAPRPTRALNRAMQQAVARSRRSGVEAVAADSVVRAIAKEDGTFAADLLERYRVTGG